VCVWGRKVVHIYAPVHTCTHKSVLTYVVSKETYTSVKRDLH
jgi:hypothetical protein